MVAFLAPALAAAAVGGSLFGKQKGVNPGQSQSGFAALPQEVQQAWLKEYLPQILQQQGKYTTTPLGQAGTGQFDSLGLQQLQDYSNQTGGIFGNGLGVNPLGTVEPFNPAQKTALSSFSSGLAGLQNELPGYQNLYNENVLNPQLAEIDQQKAMLQNQLKSNQVGTGGMNAFSNSAYGTQLAALDDQINRLKMNARVGAYTSGQDLRRQTLEDMLRAGGIQQQQGQNVLNALQPSLQQTTPQAMAANLAQGLNQIPTSQTTTGASAGTPNVLAKIGGAGMAGLGLGNFLGAKGFGAGM